MSLTMRPTGLGSRIDKDRPDHSVYSGEWEVGRIHESPCNLCWFWLMSLNGPMKVWTKLEEID
jgi:hypothetical protein